MSGWRQKLPYISALVMLNIFLLAYSLDFDFTNLINGGDTQTLLNPTLFIRKSFFIWEDTITGVALFTPGSWLPYAFLLFIFRLIFNNMILSSFIFYVTLFSLSSISMFLFSIKIISEKKSTIGLNISVFLGIFYSFNLYTAIVFHTPVSNHLYLFGITPLLVNIFMEIEESNNFRKKMKWVLFYVLLYWPLIRMINMFLIYLVLIPLIGSIVNYGIRIPVKRFFKYCAVVSISTFLVASPVIFLGLFGKSMPMTEIYTKSAVELELENKVIDSMRFIRTFIWKCSSNEEIGGILSYSFSPYYQQNPLLVVLTFYPILMIFFLFLYFFPKIQKQDKSRILGILLLTILALIFTTPSLTPIGELLYKNKIYILRSAWKYFSIPYILCLSIILTLLLKQFITKLQKRKLIVLIISLLLIHSIYIFPAICVYGRRINQAWIVKIPEEYYGLTEFLQTDPGDYRILPLPITKHFAGYVPYKWGYVGPDILYTLTNKPIIDKHHNVIAPQEYLDLMNQIETETPKEVLNLCKIINVKYILLRGDVDTDHPYIKLNYSPDYYKEFLDNSKLVEKKRTFRNLTLYELKSYTPRIFIQPINISKDSNLLTTFNKITYKTKKIKYLWFNETPITIKKYDKNKKAIKSFLLNVTFKPSKKNTTSEDWKIINNVLIQTELFKIAFSPKGLFYIFLYFKNKTHYSIISPFQRMDKLYLLEIIFQNNILSAYLDKSNIFTGSINATELVDKFETMKIGSNFGNTEMLVGKIYDLNCTINNVQKINTQTLFQNYPDYIKQEETLKLNLNPKTIKWVKLSPTKYIIKMNNTTQTQKRYFLTFLTSYDSNWKAYITQNGSKKQINEKYHIKTLKYANTWYIIQTGPLKITIEYEPQKWFYYGSITSITILLVCFSYLNYNWTKKQSLLETNKNRSKKSSSIT